MPHPRATLLLRGLACEISMVPHVPRRQRMQDQANTPGLCTSSVVLSCWEYGRIQGKLNAELTAATSCLNRGTYGEKNDNLYQNTKLRSSLARSLTESVVSMHDPPAQRHRGDGFANKRRWGHDEDANQLGVADITRAVHALRLRDGDSKSKLLLLSIEGQQ